MLLVTFANGSCKMLFKRVEYELEFSKLERKVKSHFPGFMFVRYWCRIRLKIVADIPILKKIARFNCIYVVVNSFNLSL